MLLSIIPVIISKENIPKQSEVIEVSKRKRILNILLVFITVGFFWGVYEVSNIRILDLQFQFSEISSLDIPKYFWQAMGSIYTLIISAVATIVWSYFYSSKFFKLIIGFIFGVISFGLLLLIPEVPIEHHTITYLISLFILGISEVYIAPIINATLTKYSNPKYLAILMSLVFVPTRLIALIFGLFNEIFYDNPILGLKFGIISLTIIGFGLFILVMWNKQYSYKT